jgi:hypothetical protein
MEEAGSLPASMRITNVFTERMLTAAERDPVVAEQFLRVTGMMDSPAKLLQPSALLRIAQSGRRRG